MTVLVAEILKRQLYQSPEKAISFSRIVIVARRADSTLQSEIATDGLSKG